MHHPGVLRGPLADSDRAPVRARRVWAGSAGRRLAPRRPAAARAARRPVVVEPRPAPPAPAIALPPELPLPAAAERPPERARARSEERPRPSADRAAAGEERPRSADARRAKQEIFGFAQPGATFQLPPVSLLKAPAGGERRRTESEEELRQNAEHLRKRLEDFGVKGHIARINPGPVITGYEFEPGPGIKVNQVVNLADDLALAMKAGAVRVFGPVPGRGSVAIEVPNAEPSTVSLREILLSKEFKESKAPLALALGRDAIGQPAVARPRVDAAPPRRRGDGGRQVGRAQRDDLLDPLPPHPRRGAPPHDRSRSAWSSGCTRASRTSWRRS